MISFGGSHSFSVISQEVEIVFTLSSRGELKPINSGCTPGSGNWLRMCVLITQLCPTLSDPMDYSPPGSSVHGLLQVRMLEWVAIPFSRGSSQPRDWTWVSSTAGRFFTDWATRGAQAQNRAQHSQSQTRREKETFSGNSGLAIFAVPFCCHDLPSSLDVYEEGFSIGAVTAILESGGQKLVKNGINTRMKLKWNHR